MIFLLLTTGNAIKITITPGRCEINSNNDSNGSYSVNAACCSMALYTMTSFITVIAGVGPSTRKF